MKKLLISAFALAAFSGSATAADYYAPAPVSYDWNGLYIGGHAGYLWGEADISEEGSVIGGGDFDGFVGGVVGGWNFQSGNWVFGVEGDFGWTGVDGTGETMDLSSPIYSYDMDWNAHVRGRVGITLGEEGRTLLYVAGGLALADFHLDDTGGAWQSPIGGTYTGWTIGGGANHAFSNNMIAGIEVLYDDYGSKTYEWADGCSSQVTSCTAQIEEYNVDLTAFTVRGTLTYKFKPY